MAQPPVLAPPARGSDFSPLLREIKSAGLLERRTAAYAMAIGINVALMALTWAGIAAIGASWWVLLLALPLGVLTTRAAFFGHDAGHQQIASSRKLHDWIGMLHGNLVLGMSYAWWNDKHNRHHANPNHTDKDPDVGEGVLVWTLEQASGRKGLEGWLTRNQARIFFPLLTLEGFNLKVSSIRFLLARKREQKVELGLMAAHLVLYFTALFLILSPAQALVFALVHHMIFGLHLGSVFAPNHKGMEMPADDVNWGHLEKQVLTSRNVNGGLVIDWMMGGLNYQIEHHLFPSMPRANLRFAQPMVKAYCEKIGMPYLSTGLIDSYRMGLRHMHEVGAELRAQA
ncbi:fatty acid desaturase family protein [Kribbella solani]|uniref:Fatty acid desaturase n=1 Tax=Kribbella solani TaxID=236067 RepID=A0A841DJH3_9ACTN|nr:acyl-CoA desaturase [Kribbella solani]MBB5976840.1 fatty acid desaturase [Kribbella solani]MDX2970236.1 acyl-CoA desaturase [Kribbella solani]MDX3005862.1 acyl-CoA desaturase [Kribbella solani]